MTEVWKVQGLSSTQKIVLLSLADNANDQGECYPSVSMLMEKCSLSDRAVQKALAELIEIGHISRSFRNGRATIYTVHPRTTFTPERSSPPNVVHPTPEPDSPPPPNHVHPTPERGSPITVNEPSVEPSKNRKSAPKREVSVSELVADGLSEQTASELLAHRKRKRADLTPRAWEGIKSEASKAGWSAEQAVAKLLTRGWTAFEADWLKPQERGSPAEPSKSGKHSGFDRKNYREGVTEDGSLV
ncbi:helix-turn-helix domain-containing protein [Schlegelella sp. S2-27]|uniref:Helix-turn-helix domain-containing protein n=1 Tax=Caldimonas mangrovi TaxID=2944811 RepID=A0ABT0YVY6_9BURK|nr:helix-turn-helix domain-containing protein [Caldimonas mangrovi]MCM5682915.1 helix-turn-helix domain-containing protein [Caldimonas mangrovi]